MIQFPKWNGALKWWAVGHWGWKLGNNYKALLIVCTRLSWYWQIFWEVGAWNLTFLETGSVNMPVPLGEKCDRDEREIENCLATWAVGRTSLVG